MMEPFTLIVSSPELQHMQSSSLPVRNLHARHESSVPVPDFNYVFLVYLIITAIVAIFFLLYLNRLFGWLVSYAIRTYTWHKYRIYIKIQALQISLLGGRIFVSGLRYHGENETFHIQQGYFTWCYWLRNVRNLGLLNNDQQSKGSEGESTKPLPCRFAANLVGVEWFVYNRTAVYDSILESLLNNAPTKTAVATSMEQLDHAESIRQRATRVSGDSVPQVEKHPSRQDSKRTDDYSKSQDRPRTKCSDGCDSDIPLMLRVFPIHLEVNKAALVMGNENTKAVLVVKADDLSGDIDAIATDTPDPYRQIFNMRFKHPVIEMRQNVDYREDQAMRATREKKNSQGDETPSRRSFFARWFSWWRSSIRNLIPSWQKSVESLSTTTHSPIDTANSQIPGVSNWQGLSRYLDDQAQDDKARWAHVEYAAQPVIIDSPRASMCIFWDSPTKVPELLDPALRSKEDPYALNINSEVPPAWGINLEIKGGVVNYGPWADRCRADIQKVFFPGLCKDAVPTPSLATGEYRVATQFQLYVQLDDDVTIRILTREDSKNWKFKGSAPPISRVPKRKRRDKKDRHVEPAGQARQPGWLELKVAPNSTINYTMDMVAGAKGFSTKVDVDFPSIEMSSSVNHQILLHSGAFRVLCDLSTPLQWNSLRTWYFDIFSNGIKLFLLRDHIFLMTDLVDDWGSGPLTDYLLFTPFKYMVNLDFRKFELYLNVNDANVIDNATSLDENMFLVLGSPELTAALEIPLDFYRPAKNAIPFEARLDPLIIGVQLPPWYTQATFTNSKNLGRAECLVIKGKYEYNATTSVENTDTLVLDLYAKSPVAKIFGSTMRFFLKLKDNYFGDDMHFRTVQEYQDMLQLKERNPGAETTNKAPYKKSNDMDVILSVKVDDIKAFLPGNLHSAGKNIQIEAASITADARFTNYYMDLELILSPLSLALGVFPEDESILTSASATTAQLFIDGIRVFGHRLFGLPPIEPTYVCNWDLSVGVLTGECNTDFLSTLVLAGKSFGFTFDDEENALVSFTSIVFYDITFLRLAVQSVKLWVHIDNFAFLISLDTIDIDYNDWARSHYSKKANILLPNLQISCIDTEDEAHGKNRSFGSAAGTSSKNGDPTPIDADLMFQTTIRLTMIGRKFHFTEERKTQQDLVRREDQRTHRTPFLLFPEFGGPYIPEVVDRPAQDVPPIPDSLNDGFLSDDYASSMRSGRTGESGHSSATSQFSRRSQHTRRTAGSNTLRRQSSFLSFSSAVSNKSVLRPSNSSNDGTRSFISRAQSHSHTQSIGERWRDAAQRSSSYSEMVEATNDVQDATKLSSKFLAPRFPLENVVPQSRDVDKMQEEHSRHAAEHRDFMAAEFPLHEIDPHGLSEECAYMSFVVEFPSGITGFFSPISIQKATKLIGALQPSSPDDILDALHLSSMGIVLDLKKDSVLNGTILDFMVCLPAAHIRFLNTSMLDFSESLLDEQDQYDVQLSKLAVVMRNTKTWEDVFRLDAHKSRLSFQGSCGQIVVSASERLQGGPETQAAVQAFVDTATVSMGSRDIMNINASVETITCSTSSGKIQYLASLIHRTSVLAQSLSATIDESLGRQQDRIQFLVHQLMSQDRSIPDPAFIVRGSAILRSVPGHLRFHDSWKMIQRLRQLWTKMDPKSQKELATACLSSRPGPVPPDVREQVAAAFTKWRGWDLEDLDHSVLMKEIFSSFDHEAQPKPDDLPLIVACRVGQIEMVLDPGPKQNRAALMGMQAKVQANDERSSSETGEGPEPLTVVNIHCRQALVKINWELCELTDDVLELYASTTTAKDKMTETPLASPRTGTSVSSSSKKTTKKQEAFHVVLAMGEASLDVDTINLHSRTHLRGLNGSTLVNILPQGVNSANLIVGAEAVTAKLYSHSQKLGLFQLYESSLFLSHEGKQEATKDSHVIKCVPSSKSMRIKIKQDPLALLEIADLLIRDEFAQLYKIKKSLPVSKSERSSRPQTASSGSQPRKRIAEKLSTIKINVAMFLNDYDIRVPLTQSLTYNITGVVARAAVATNFGKELIFDFDIKENSHSIIIASASGIREISLLQIPPTNGRVRNVTMPTEHTISVATSLEMVQLDASAVYTLLMSLNRPQLSAEIQDVQEMVGVLQEHFQEVIGPIVPVNDHESAVAITPESPSVPMVYRVHLSLAGLHVFGKTSLTSDPDPLAYIAFSLEKVHFEATNHLSPGQPVLKTPHVNVNLSHIAFDIRKGHESAMRSCGSLSLSALLSLTSMPVPDSKEEEWALTFQTSGLEIMLSPETISTAIDIMSHMGDKIKDLDTTRERKYLRKLRQSNPKIRVNDTEVPDAPEIDRFDSVLESFVYHFEIRNITVCWLVSGALEETEGQEDLVLTVELIGLSTRKAKSARLEIQNLQLQMVPIHDSKDAGRSHHSALLPEIIFNVASFSTGSTRRMAFQAVGKSVEVRLTSGFMIPATHLQESIARSAANIQKATENWTQTQDKIPETPLTATSAASSVATSKSTTEIIPSPGFFGRKRFESLLIHADFAGAMLHLSGRRIPVTPGLHCVRGRANSGGKYGQFKTDDSNISASLRSPGLAWRMEYRDNGTDRPALNGEVKVEGSSNTLYPTVVPLIMDISSSFKEIVEAKKHKPGAPVTKKAEKEKEKKKKPRMSESTSWLGTVVSDKDKGASDDDNTILVSDPSMVLGKLNLNLGLRIAQQQFTLSCQPIARVAASGSFAGIYTTINTVHSAELGNLIAITSTCSKLQASVQHVYSRESTASFEVDSIVLSLMNNKHFSGTTGVSALLKVSPMVVTVNARQMQDFLLFGEIWYPKEMRTAATEDASSNLNSDTQSPTPPSLNSEGQQAHLVARYQQVAATAAFPWTATVSIESLDMNLDMGQAVGKSVFEIKDFWVSSRKTSDWEQNLCLGFERIGMTSTGRMSGFVALRDFRVRTSIQWPMRERALSATPLIQASIAFSQFRLKASWDYQAFLVADITKLDFLMYNVRREGGDRLVAILDGDAVQAFGTSGSAAQGIGLWRAIGKFFQERRTALKTSLGEIEQFSRRRTVSSAVALAAANLATDARKGVVKSDHTHDTSKAPISLDTDVVVMLKAVNLGVFPLSFTDHQVFKIEAQNAQARFAANIVEGPRLHSLLDLTLGQLRVGLAGVRSERTMASDLSVEEVVTRSTGARGGTILKVPKVQAIMETWQTTSDEVQGRPVDYTFSSKFEGKVEVGWNYSRISYIRGMWASHVASLEGLGVGVGDRPMVVPLKVTGVPGPSPSEASDKDSQALPSKTEKEKEEERKITAEVNVPVSKYEYRALTEPVIQTPQLKDMGEATPPLEWIGLHRDRLPNLTHQIVIVTLLELAGEVEDAYSRILGSS